MTSYWLDLFTVQSWQEFLEAGGNVSGFGEHRMNIIKQIKEGDLLLCYLIKISRYIGLLRVTGTPFMDITPIWEEEVFPCRVPVEVLVALTPETAVPVKSLAEKLSYFRDMQSPLSWSGHFRGSPRREKREDAMAIISAINEARDNPVQRPIDTAKLGKQPKLYPTKDGEVTVPEDIDSSPKISGEISSVDISHEEIQHLLLSLGSNLGMDLWVARNDRNKMINGMRLGEFSRMKSELPLQFDSATNRTIELIDVLWLKGNTIIAAFEVEHTTSIYSGLLRMSDLIAMQPNLNIKLYIVAPDNRREKVVEEINRPTFSRLKPALNEYCQYISYSLLSEKVKQITSISVAEYLKPEFIDVIAESCVIA